MDSKIFNRYYKKLNPEQKKAVDAVEGPVMVIAGPGTGKTQILTLRIANILRVTDTEPDNILALTFTESAAFSMRKRLVEIVGSDGYRVWINTFHGFCNEIIRRYPEEFPRIIGANAMDDVDKVLLLKDVIVGSNAKHLKPYGDNFFFLNPIAQKISEMKRENIPPDGLLKIVKAQEKEFNEIPDLYHEKGGRAGEMKAKYIDEQKRIEKNKELYALYKKYESELSKKRLYDYEDMIIETIKALEKNKDLLLRLQEEFQYILADEHQDVNNSQNKLLDLLSNYHESPNIFIVGDEKQAIYRFQGASLENFLYFRDRFKNVLTVNLLNNYRSIQSILDASQNLIEKGYLAEKNLRKPLTSKIGKDFNERSILVREFSSDENEYRFLAEDIMKKIEEGVESSEIAVLFRNNKDAEGVVRVFEQKGISFTIRSEQNILNDIDIQKIIKLFRATEHFGNDSYLLEILHINFLGLNNMDVYKIARYSKKKGIPMYEIIKSSEHLEKAGVKNRKKVKSIYSLLSSWKTLSKNKGFLEFFETVIYESGLIKNTLDSQYSVEKLEKINSLFETVKTLVEKKRDYSLSDFLEYLELLDAYGISIKQKSAISALGSVQLMTAHRAKGMEFEYVYIINCFDGHWGNKRVQEYFKIPKSKANITSKEMRNDDERRLFYVALTRAKSEVNISYTAYNAEGASRLPSEFLEEIDENKKQKENVVSFENTLLDKPLFLPRKSLKPKANEKEFLNELFLEQGLSVTALNNYLDCPFKYFYNNLLRVPRVPKKSMLYGTAIHKALKDFFDRLKEGEFGANGEKAKEKALLTYFLHYINEQSLSDDELKESVEKGKETLSGYFKKYKGIWEINTLNEFKVTILLPVEIKGIERLRLRGDIDKIEFLDDSNNVNVVDYKTGKQRSRNEILGNTKNSNGDYKRQLDFYKLLLDRYKDGEYNMVSGEIDFIEPNKNGNYKKERFEIERDDTEELKKIIQKIAEEILELSFWCGGCGDLKCEYCVMQRMKEQKS